MGLVAIELEPDERRWNTGELKEGAQDLGTEKRDGNVGYRVGEIEWD